MTSVTLPHQPAARPDILLDTGHVAALYQKRAGETLIVSFAPRQERPSIWGQAFLGRFGVSLLGLTDYHASWFPEQDMAQILPRLEGLLAGYRRVVLYGFSMGAYAALKYSGRLRASVTLAFSPQFSIEPGRVGHFDHRRARLFHRPELHDGMHIAPGDLGGQALLFLDPLFREDASHAALIAQAGPVACVPTPFSRHDSIRFAVNAGLVEWLLWEATWQGRVDEGEARRLRRARRLLCPDYVRAVAGLMERRAGPAAGMRLLGRALAAGNDTPALHLEHAQRLLDEARVAEAEAALCGLPEALKPAQQAVLADVLRRMALHTGQDAPDPRAFPASDPAWAETAEFIRQRRLPGETVLAPASFGKVLEGCAAALPEEARPDWAVVRKSAMAGLGHPRLRELALDTTPVFANAEFVVWARQPSFGMVDLRGTPEVRAMLRDIEGMWGEIGA